MTEKWSSYQGAPLKWLPHEADQQKKKKKKTIEFALIANKLESLK